MLDALCPRALRRLALLALVVAGCGNNAPPTLPQPEPELPITGVEVPGMASFDQVIPELMQRWRIPGGAVAVVRDGRLVFARGYGYADLETSEPVQPAALFRVASLAKPVTAVAILKLVEEGRLDLDARAFEILDHLEPLPNATVDARMRSITIRQLLHHSGGWDRTQSYDPMFRSTTIASFMGAPAPASAETVIRFMLGQPLNFTPGERYAYSNLGYAVLGRVIEKITGESYEQYVQRAILAPVGVTRMLLGRSLPESRAAGEVRYYDPAHGESVFPGGGSVPFPYGGFYLEAMDSHGGWIASTIDLLRFLTAVDELPTRPDILRPETIRLMVAAPPAPLWQNSAVHYGMGWLVRPAQGNWWHDGSLPGTSALLVRTGSGLAWAVLFNARQMEAGSMFEQQLDPAIWQAVNGVTQWPTHDLFDHYP